MKQAIEGKTDKIMIKAVKTRVIHTCFSLKQQSINLYYVKAKVLTFHHFISHMFHHVYGNSVKMQGKFSQQGINWTKWATYLLRF